METHSNSNIIDIARKKAQSRNYSEIDSLHILSGLELESCEEEAKYTAAPERSIKAIMAIAPYLMRGDFSLDLGASAIVSHSWERG
jgi:hypothetical protein